MSLFFSSCHRNLPKTPDKITSLNLENTDELATGMGVFSYDKGGYEKWWELFQDATLSSLMEETVKKSPYLEAVKEKILIAKALAQQEKSLLLPKLGLDFDESYEHLSKNGLFRFPPSLIPAVIDQLDLKVNFEYEFDFFGKNQHLLKAALGHVMASMADYAAAQLVMTIELAQHYFYYQYLLEFMQLLEEKIEIQRELLAITEKRVEHALSDRIDLEKFRQQVLDLENLAVINEMGMIIEIHLINRLRGVSPDEKLQVSTNRVKDVRSIPIAQHLSLDLISQRPDIISMKWMIESALHQVGAARAAFYPSVNLAAFTGIESIAWNDLFSPHSWVGALRPAIHLPLYTGGKLTANLKDKMSIYHKMIYEYNDLILKAAGEVADGVTLATSYTEEIEIQRVKYLSMSETLFLLDKRYEFAVDPIMNSLEYRLNYLEQENIIFNKEYQKRLAMLKIIKALGGGYQVEDIDQKPREETQ